MKRDDDLIRNLMLEIEDRPDPLYVFPQFMSMSKEDLAKYYHLRLLTDEGLLQETGKTGGIFRMTSKGHDFVAAIRGDTVWAKTKEAAGHVAGVSLSMMKDIALGYVRQELTKLGIPLG